MSLIREAELPGLGKKYEITLENDEKIVVVIHDDGKREIYNFTCDDDDPCSSIILTDQEARQIGSIIGGAFYQPKALERLEAAVSDLRIEWLKVLKDSSISGRSIGELGLRKNHGITVIALIEEQSKDKKNTRINPGPSVIFQPGQTVIVAGKAEKIQEFENEFF